MKILPQLTMHQTMPMSSSNRSRRSLGIAVTVMLINEIRLSHVEDRKIELRVRSVEISV